MMTAWLRLSMGGLASLVMLSIPTMAEVVLRSVRLELMQGQYQFRDDSILTAARGDDWGYLDIEAEFEDTRDIDRAELRIRSESYQLEEYGSGGLMVFEGFLGPISSYYADRYTLRVELDGGETQEFEFEVDQLDFLDYPEVSYPFDGADEVDADQIELSWDSFGDQYRLDLFEWRTTYLERLEHTRTLSERFDLMDWVSTNRPYEIWVGATRETQPRSDTFDLDVWFTSTVAVRFITGPRKRDEVSGVPSTDRITSHQAGYESVRFGQTNPEFTERIVARLEGENLRGAETARIRDIDDARLRSTFSTIKEIQSSTVMQGELSNTNAGDAILFLVEFNTDRLGAESCTVDSPLNLYPEIQTPSSNQTGISAPLQVSWTFAGTASDYLVELIPQATPEIALQRKVTNLDPVVFGELPWSGDYWLSVTAWGANGSSATTMLNLSTWPAGDVNQDGRFDSTDLFGVVAAWGQTLIPTPNLPYQLPWFRLDLNHNERLDQHDLLLALRLLKK